MSSRDPVARPDIFAPGPARTLVADPPWPFGDALPGPGRGAVKHYAIMSLDEIAAFELPELADDCRLFLWRVAAMQREALDVLDCWGFTVKAELVWRKTTLAGDGLRIGMGRQVRNAHEVCLIGVRGRPGRLDASIPSVFDSPPGKHSEKPEAFRELVERLSPGPYAELFARRARRAWRCYGLEVET